MTARNHRGVRDPADTQAMSNRRIHRLAMCILCAILVQPVVAGDEVRVGIYQNAPKVFLDEEHGPSGFFPDIVNAIGQAEGWQLRYVPCVWNRCLALLEAGDIDIMVDVAHTPAREERFDFGREVVLASWSVVYKRPDTYIDSILDLDKKRVAILTGSVQHSAMQERAARFDVFPDFVGTDSFDEAFELLRQKQVDFVLANRFYGDLNMERYGAEKTNILIRPSSLKFAFPKQSDPELLQVTDRYIRQFKQDRTSVYYQSIQRWLSPLEAFRLPGWVKWTLLAAAVALVLLAILVLLLRKVVVAKTAQIAREKQHYYHLSMHDPLTNLPNRLFFFEHLEGAMSKADLTRSSIYVFFIDLDQFKHINDSVGHIVGDNILKQVAGRLEHVALDIGLIARLGGDEFALLSDGCGSRSEAAVMAKRLLSALDKPFADSGSQFFLSTSVGISVYPYDGNDAQEIMKNADTALFSAKGRGRKTYEFYDHGMSDHAMERISLESDLRDAMDRQEFVLHYQPQIDLETGDVVGMEALIRWQHPEKGLIAPGHFIPIAEDTGMIIELGEWVLRTACEQMAAWQREGSRLRHIAVNVSPQQIQDESFYASVNHILEETGCRPEWVEIEITETAFLCYSQENLELLEKFKALGFGVAIDDFGTGQSSLSRLKHLPVTKLKIDISFIAGLPDDRSDVAITQAIIALGEGLGICVLAEGIESNAQREFVTAAGCREGQGYLFGRPAGSDQSGPAGLMNRAGND